MSATILLPPGVFAIRQVERRRIWGRMQDRQTGRAVHSRATDRRVFRRRRLVAACLLIALIALVVGVGRALWTGGSSSTAPSLPAVATGPDGSVVTSSTPRVLLLGDSDAVGLDGSLRAALGATSVTTVAKSASGLARPDFYDWPTAMQRAVGTAHPTVVVVALGANDGQGLRAKGGRWVVAHAPASHVDDASWIAEYSARVGAAMDTLTAGGATVVWLGVPNHPSSTTRARLRVQDSVVRAEAGRRKDRVVYIDTWKLFDAPDGSYAKGIVDPGDATWKVVRAPDGFHLNRAGVRILAAVVVSVVHAHLGGDG